MYKDGKEQEYLIQAYKFADTDELNHALLNHSNKQRLKNPDKISMHSLIHNEDFKEDFE